MAGGHADGAFIPQVLILYDVCWYGICWMATRRLDWISSRVQNLLLPQVVNISVPLTMMSPCMAVPAVAAMVQAEARRARGSIMAGEGNRCLTPIMAPQPPR